MKPQFSYGFPMVFLAMLVITRGTWNIMGCHAMWTQELVLWLKGYQQAQCALSSCVLLGTNLNYASLYACHLRGTSDPKCEQCGC